MNTLELVDASTKKTYQVFVSPEEKMRALSDMMYASVLLQREIERERALSAETETIDDPEPSNVNDPCDPDESICSTIDGSDAAGEGTHRWSDGAVKLLVALLREYEENPPKNYSKTKMWQLFSDGMKAKGHDITPGQCKSKVEGLKKTYKRVRDHNNISGNGRKDWKYYELMDAAIGKNPSSNHILTLDSEGHIGGRTAEEGFTGKKRKLVSDEIHKGADSVKVRAGSASASDKTTDKMIAVLEANAAERRAMHQAAMDRQDKFLDLLSKLVK